ncbi:hypothetical protein ACIRQP_33825 [Streptomyces sp. NPDC102274]|uniref:hypothetical protein n=1 Tax=Streptomyces sp. NPDC102274 TaxID=3366151 RepID=UPI00380D9BC4
MSSGGTGPAGDGREPWRRRLVRADARFANGRLAERPLEQAAFGERREEAQAVWAAPAP